MTEQEWTDVSDRERISIAIEVLRVIIPEDSKVIDIIRHTEILKDLSAWREKLREEIKITG
jgi:hypothetical protein